MSKTWVIADPHFGHQGVCNFKQADGVTPLRPWDRAAEMDGALIENWNSLVDDQDRVYVLGDVAMTKKALWPLKVLKGRKVLVKGNHDIEKMSVYQQYFDDIRACVVKKGFIMTHIPIHPASLSRWKLNVHGHLHSNVVLQEDGKPDPRYMCVSVEHTDFKPLDLQVILNKVNQ